MKRTFTDIHVGDILYWGAIGMDHVTTTIVTNIHLNLDGEHLPKLCDVTFETNEGFKFDICNCLLDKHDCIIFTHIVNDNEIYIGTTKEAVAYQITKYLTSKIRFWSERKARFLDNYQND